MPVVFITRDINLRIRADAVGLQTANYEEEGSVSIEEMYPGRAEIEVPGGKVDAYLKDGWMDSAGFELLPNQCVTIIDEKDQNHTALGRHYEDKGNIMPLLGENEDISGISARNREQSFAVDLLLDDSLQVVTLAGKAGTGKTLLAIAAGLRKAMEDNRYSKLVVARPILPMGKDLGFLPGEVGEKIRPWMQPVFDNLELILHSRKDDIDYGEEPRKSRGKKRGKKPMSQGINHLIDMGILEIEPLTYIRGRSLPQQYLIIDEAQNLTHHEVKTVITRAGEGTKVVLTGDPYQIDNPFLDSSTSGLTVVVERFKGEKLAGHITLLKGERSSLAELASNLL